MPDLHAAIFDLDGTLLDSAPDLRQALNLTLRGYDRRDLTLDEVKNMVGDGMLVTLHRAFATTGAPISQTESNIRFQHFIEHYRNQKADPAQIYPHVVETLTALRQRGIKIALCTNKQEAATLRLLDELDLTRHFDVITGGDTFSVHKPHPGHVLGVLDRLRLTAPHAVMIGDSTNDVRAAQSAGVPSIVITHGYAIDARELGADQVIDRFTELQDALRILGFAGL